VAKGSSSLVLRVFDGKTISEPRMLPLEMVAPR
jgi:hypothetical protein